MKHIHSVIQPSPLSSSRTSLSPRNETVCPSSSYYPFSPPLSLREPPIYFLYGFVYSGHFIWMGSDSMWLLHLASFSLSIMFLRFIPFVTCVSISYLLMAFYLSIYQLMVIWVVPTFWLLWMVLFWTFMCKFLCECMSSVFWSMYLGVELLGHMAALTFQGTSVQLYYFTFPLAVYEDSFLPILANTCSCLPPTPWIHFI